MAKKIKPNSLLENEQPLDVVNEKTTANNSSSFNEEHSTSLLGNGKMTAEAKEKLEKYDALESTVLELTKEKQILEDKIAEYVEKLENIKHDDSTIKKLNAEIADLKNKLNDVNSHVSSTNENDLKDECKRLRNEADGYLVKISELTFENANLTCQLNELKNNSKVSHKPPTVSPLAQPMKDPYNPYKNNGYGTW